MRPFRRVLVGSLSVALFTGVAALTWLAEANGAAPSSIQQPHGINVMIHSGVDPNFCLQDTPKPADPTSEAEVSSCISRDNQHWTLADTADGSVVIIGGSTANCLGFSAEKSINVEPCTFGTAERFLFKATGQIKAATGKNCLEAAEATQDAATFVAKCAKDDPLQTWSLSR